jgi:mannitol 2-dehydrogenase
MMFVLAPDSSPYLDAVLREDRISDIPNYDRGSLVPSVVHIGVGGFHRAHQALYFDELANGGNLNWGVVGVGLRRPEMGEVLRQQYGLYTVVEMSLDGERPRVVGSLTQYLFAPDDPGAVVRALADPRTRLVTLTVTGDGYLTGPDGSLLEEHPDVTHDLAQPAAPVSMVGFIVEGLRVRRAAGSGPFTVLSCDNLPDSAAAARTAITSFARRRDVDLADWIERTVTFPSSMVDRITPETSPQRRDEIVKRIGLPDDWPVITEPFRQWVIEDRFCNSRPPLEQVGVQFVPDVAPYKLIKGRTLNGGHTALGYIGTLLGHTTTAEAMCDGQLRQGLERMLAEEVLPLLPEVSGMELGPYLQTTLDRFANPAIADALSRLCRRGSTKVRSYLLPSLHDARQRGGRRRLLVVALAAWLRYLRGTDLGGQPLKIEDPLADLLQARIEEGGADPRPILEVREVFGDLVDDAPLVAEIRAALEAWSHCDARGALELLGWCD